MLIPLPTCSTWLNKRGWIPGSRYCHWAKGRGVLPRSLLSRASAQATGSACRTATYPPVGCLSWRKYRSARMKQRCIQSIGCGSLQCLARTSQCPCYKMVSSSPMNHPRASRPILSVPSTRWLRKTMRVAISQENIRSCCLHWPTSMLSYSKEGSMVL